MDNKIVRTREELIEAYNLSEEDQVYLLDVFEKIEQEVFKMLSSHL
ncbi:hypothetical protein [Alkalibaculum sporogenes]|nr:hypothetical protein [Alkalibaculum sporogenes]